MENSDIDIPNLVTDSDSDEWDSDQSMPGLSSESDSESDDISDSEIRRDSPSFSFISSGAMTTQNAEGSIQVDIPPDIYESPQQLPTLVTDSDSDDSGWSTVDDTTETTDSSDDDDYMFDDSLSDDSSVGDDDEYGVFEMLSHHFEVFSNAAPSFFGVSLQMLYERLMETLDGAEDERDTPTPQNILDSLPTFKVTIAQVASTLSCCICFGEYVLNEELLKLPCTHFYHKGCIMNWLKIKSTCPTCRLDLTKHEIPDSNSPSTNSPVHSINSSLETIDITDVHGDFNTGVIDRVRRLSSNSSGPIETIATNLATNLSTNVSLNTVENKQVIDCKNQVISATATPTHPNDPVCNTTLQRQSQSIERRNQLLNRSGTQSINRNSTETFIAGNGTVTRSVTGQHNRPTSRENRRTPYETEIW